MRYYDQHVHTYYSEDCTQNIEAYLLKTVELGLTSFAVSDHLDLDFVQDGLDWVYDVKKQKKELEELNKKFPSINILQGIEIGYKDSALNRLYEVIDNNDFDFINLSLHDFDHLDVYEPSVVKKYGLKEINIAYLKKLNECIKKFKDYDVVTHIDFCFKSCYLVDNCCKFSDYEDLISDVMKTIIEKDKCIEINLKVQEVINDEHTSYILNLYKKLGGKNITLSSDAHTVDRLCINFDHYISLIKKAGFDHLNYFIKRSRYNFPL